MAKALARGVSYEQMTSELHKRFIDVSEANIMRLVQTEGTYVARAAQAAELKCEGFDSYYINPVGDERTCEVCEDVGKHSHDEVYRFDDAVVGQNFPPLHPRCRCQIALAVSDWDAWQKQQIDRHRAETTKRNISGHKVSSGEHKVSIGRYTQRFGEPEVATFNFNGKAIWGGIGDVGGVELPEKEELVRLMREKNIDASLSDLELTHTHTTRVGGTLSVDDVRVLVDYELKSNSATETQGEKRCFVLERTSKANKKLSNDFLNDYKIFSDETWDDMSFEYWEKNCKPLGIPLYNTDTTDVEKAFKSKQHEWLIRNAQRYGYNYYVK